MTTEFTHIRISEDTKRHLNELRAPWQSYDGLLRELIWLGYEHIRPTNPILPGEKPSIEPIQYSKAQMKPYKLGEMKRYP